VLGHPVASRPFAAVHKAAYGHFLALLETVQQGAAVLGELHGDVLGILTASFSDHYFAFAELLGNVLGLAKDLDGASNAYGCHDVSCS
jgi:hypothetical protein